MLRIVHVITGLNTGGAERMLVQLLAASHPEAFSHEVISLTGRGSLAVEIEGLGVPVLALGNHILRYNPGKLLALRRRFDKACPTLIHGWMYHGAIAALLTAGRRPVIAAIHHSLSDERHEKASTRLAIRALRVLGPRAAALAYCSAAARQQHEDIGYPHGLGLVIPNGFDTNRFRPDPSAGKERRQAFGIPEDAFVIGHFARFNPMKDHATLIQAVGGLMKANPRMWLVLVGRGVTDGNRVLARLIESFTPRDRLQVLGEQQEIPSLMNMCDVVVTSSKSEAFPMVLGEAMACGIPCVATNTGDSAVIVGKTGWIVPPERPEALAAALASVARMDVGERRSLGEAARQRIIQHFGVHAVAQAYGSLYKRVAGYAE